MLRKFFALAALLTAAVVIAAPAEPKKADFQPPKLSTADSWSMIVVPDVQTYTKLPRNHGIVEIMNAWIVENADKMKIQQVLYTGDLTYHNDHPMVNPGKNDLMADEQWKAFSRMMERLDGQVPYILCTGNHDYGHGWTENRRTYYGKFFPTDRNPLSRKQLIGCAPNAFGVVTLENAAYEFTAPAPDGRKFLVISLEFSPRIEVLEWAKKLVDEPRFANHIGIVVTHSYMFHTGPRIGPEKYAVSKAGGQSGEEIWAKLVYPAKNIRMVICGHVVCGQQLISGMRTDKNSAGKDVVQMVFNAQNVGGGKHGNGGDGWLRILEFMPDKKTVKASSFSPFFAVSPSTQHLAWNKSASCEFTFTIE